MTTLESRGDWKSKLVAEEYLEDSMSSKNEVSRVQAGIPSGFGCSLQKLNTQAMQHYSTFTAGNLTMT